MNNLEWWRNKSYWIATLSGECCSTTELMGKQETDGSWTYALVLYHDGRVSLKCQFNNGAEIK